MTVYYMTNLSESQTWELCKASTLTAAKRECSRRCSGGSRDHTIAIGELVGGERTRDDGMPAVGSAIARVAAKRIGGSTWRTEP